jgi:hypothetical protein
VRNWEVRLTLKNRRRHPGLSGPKSARPGHAGLGELFTLRPGRGASPALFRLRAKSGKILSGIAQLAGCWRPVEATPGRGSVPQKTSVALVDPHYAVPLAHRRLYWR